VTRVRSQLSISLDGYVAGPRQSPQHPLGEGGLRLHEWAFATSTWRAQHGRDGGEDGPDADVAAAAVLGIGAHIMGRRMFGGGEGGWDTSWRGWWGEEPPFRAPVFVLTHHERAPLEMAGGTTFTFVTGGPQAALEAARAAAGELDVAVAGGASTVRQYLAGGLLDELHLHIVPIVLGAGERLLDGVGDLALEPLEVVASPSATHVRYRVGR